MPLRYRKMIYVAVLSFPVLIMCNYVCSYGLRLGGEVGSVIHVPGDYPSIQAAVDAANVGDTIIVAAGIYNESIIVNKSVSLVGEDRDTTVIDGNGSLVVLVNASDVILSGFTVRNGEYGVAVNYSSYCRIENNTFAQNEWFGIHLHCSARCSIYGNNISGNGVGGGFPGGGGIFALGAVNNTIVSNLISSNIVGAALYACESNFILNNTVDSSSFDGIVLVLWGNNVVQSNSITRNGNNGVEVRESHGNLVLDNYVADNGRRDLESTYGIQVNRGENNTVMRNFVRNNSRAMAVMDLANYTTVAYNTMIDNTVGAYTHYSNGSVFYKNNIINNTVQVSVGDFYPDINDWDNGAEGNYYSHLTGFDTNKDGIFDSTYVIDVRNQDRFPLAQPWNETRLYSAAWDQTTYNIAVTCNSTTAGFHFNQPNKYIGFNATGPSGSSEVCNVSIPTNFMWGDFSVVMNDTLQPCDIHQNTTHTTLCFTIPFNSTNQIRIHSTEAVPEFNPTMAMLSLALTTTTLSATIIRKAIRRPNPPTKTQIHRVD